MEATTAVTDSDTLALATRLVKRAMPTATAAEVKTEAQSLAYKLAEAAQDRLNELAFDYGQEA